MKLPSLHIPDKLKAGLLFAARILAGALFFYSGFSKLIQPVEYFEVAIGQYTVVPEAAVHYVASVIPWIEMTAGTFVFLGYMLEGAAGALGVLTAMFQIILGQALVRRLPMDECGCFGGGFVHLTLYQSFVLDTFLVLIFIQIATAERNILTLDRWLMRDSRDS